MAEISTGLKVHLANGDVHEYPGAISESNYRVSPIVSENGHLTISYGPTKIAAYPAGQWEAAVAAEAKVSE